MRGHTALVLGCRPLLCQFNGGSSGKYPGRLLLHVSRNLLLVLVAQEEERETHGGEVKLLQEPARIYKPERKPNLSHKVQFMNKKLFQHQHQHNHTHS